MKRTACSKRETCPPSPRQEPLKRAPLHACHPHPHTSCALYVGVHQPNPPRQLHRLLPRDGKGSERLQSLMFSATLHSPEIRQLSEQLCTFPTWVDLKVRDSVPETVTGAQESHEMIWFYWELHDTLRFAQRRLSARFAIDSISFLSLWQEPHTHWQIRNSHTHTASAARAGGNEPTFL